MLRLAKAHYETFMFELKTVTLQWHLNLQMILMNNDSFHVATCHLPVFHDFMVCEVSCL